MAVQIASNQGWAQGEHRIVAEHPNGTLWALVGFGDANSTLRYSTDGGATWNQSAGEMPGGGSGDPTLWGIYIDADEFMHIWHKDDLHVLRYFRGTLSGTTWSWSSGSTIDNM